MNEEQRQVWETISLEHESGTTERLKLHNGWLYRTVIYSSAAERHVSLSTTAIPTVAMCFVPD